MRPVLSFGLRVMSALTISLLAFAKFADIMGDCAEARVVAMDSKGTR